MRKPLIINLPKKQQGFSLFMVLVMMLVIAFLVVAATQSYNTEMRISSNDADRKSAFALAETALREGEIAIGDFSGTINFTADCKEGLCASAGQKAQKIETAEITLDIQDCTATECKVNAWEREGSDKKKYIEEEGRKEEHSRRYEVSRDVSDKDARYIIESMGKTTASDGSARVIYRVTSRAWGKNPNTVVTLQSYVEGSYNDK